MAAAGALTLSAACSASTSGAGAGAATRSDPSTASAPPTAAPCSARNLELRPRVDSSEPDKFLFAPANVGRTACALEGYPVIELDAGGDGRPVITHVSHVPRPTARRITLAFRSQAVFFLYQTRGGCDQARINIGRVLVTPPGQDSQLTLDVTIGLICPDRPVLVTALQR